MTEKEYLDLFNISKGKYIIGIFQDTITVYKQQRRALNIFQALIKENIIPEEGEFSIAVIGGGAAGVTFAAAALKSNISVTLLEKQASFLHMQQGCDTRKIHPNLYDWPDTGSTFPSARLPVLSWTHNTASNVAQQILGGLEDILRQIKNSQHPLAPAFFNPYVKDNLISVNDPTSSTQGKFHIVHETMKNGKPHKVNTYVNLVIYAVGYGIETGLKETNTPSYWRNDALSQSILHNNRKFLVSGVGDGALIDLCRLKIRNYSYDRMMELMKSEGKKYTALVTQLQKIKATGKNMEDRPANFYMRAFTQLTETFYEYFWDQVEPDIMQENEVILNTRRDHEDQILDFEKVSMINAFIVFLLKKDNHFSVLLAKAEFPSGSGILIDKKPPPTDYQLVIRHGTDKESVMNEMALSRAELMKLKSLEAPQKTAGYGETYWSLAGISQFFRKRATNPDFAVMNYDKRSEYVTKDTRSFCLAPLIALARTLGRRRKGHFRVALHRVTEIDNKPIFQQLTPYKGSAETNEYGCFGNIYPIPRGLVGTAAESGLPLLMRMKDRASWEALHQELNLDKVRDHSVTAQLYLAIPILATVAPGEMATNLILYLEADDPAFLDEPGILEAIMSAIDGLRDYLEQMLTEKKIEMCELEFKPEKITGTLPVPIQDNVCLDRLDQAQQKLFPSRYPFRLEKFYSFDIIFNR